MSQNDTMIRISKEAKEVFEKARLSWEKKTGRKVSAGDFIRFLSDKYLRELSSPPKDDKKMDNHSQVLMAVQEVKPTAVEIVSPGPQVLLVTCVRCGGKIGWRTDLGSDGYCPYCGIYLRLMGK